MPIYEFTCVKCAHEFEALVPRPGAKAPCPECGGKQVKKSISRPGGFAMSGGGDTSCPANGGPRPAACEST